MFWWLAVILACNNNGSTTDSNQDTDGDTDTDTVVDTGDPVEVLQLQTRDGVGLVADYYPTDAGRPAIVLLHMNPTGGWNRKDWPRDFITLLRKHDWGVVAVDRRGGGESKGESREAYEGEKGRYDVEACTVMLRDKGMSKLAIIGASNGTTSMVDYTSWAASESLPEPVALGFMTGGTYTETQTNMSQLQALPAIFTYSSKESAWSENQQSLDPGTWKFFEYTNGDHGTQMFAAKPEVAQDLDGFLGSVLD
jgi:pimeloyl-ACP methyl ester carboxylesterase